MSSVASAAPSSADPPLHFRVHYNSASYDIHTSSQKITELRRLFNSRVKTVNNADADADADAQKSPIRSIPSDFRAWVHWPDQRGDDRWVQVIDNASLSEALNDSYFVEARRVVAAKEGVSSSSGYSVLIVFRDADANSPNTSPPFHAQSSGRSRLPKHSSLAVSDLFPLPLNKVDPFTQENLEELGEDRVLLSGSHFHGALLVCASGLVQYVQNERRKHVPIFEISLTVELHTIVLKRFVWARLTSDYACPSAAEFRKIVIQALVFEPEHLLQLQTLKSNESLYHRLQCLIYDLLKLKNQKEDPDRWTFDVLYPSTADTDAEAYYSNMYLPSLYFSREEQELLSQFLTANGSTLAEAVHETVSGKFSVRSAAASSTGAHICSGHDVAPLLRAIFHLQNDYFKSASFTQMHTKYEKQLQKKLQQRMKQAESGEVAPSTAASSASVAKSAAASSSSSSSSSASSAAASSGAPFSSLPADTPQLLKLLSQQSELNELTAAGKTDAKLSKSIAALEKELKRMAAKSSQ